MFSTIIGRIVELDREDRVRMSSLSAELFPALSTSIHWGIIEAEFRLNDIVDEKLVSNISIIPFVGDQCVVFQLDNGAWEPAWGYA